LYRGRVVAVGSLLGSVLVFVADVVLHVVRGATAEGAILSVSIAGKALVTGDQLDGGSPRGREDGRPEVANVAVDVVTFAILDKLTLEVCRWSGYVVASLSMAECITRKESTMAIVLAKQNLECLVVVKPHGVQDG
jgi:hypothetical protein